MIKTKKIFDIENIGIDIVSVNRFKNKIFSKNITFYKKIFLQSEIDYCNKFKSPYEHFAGKFAIKEAVIKSIDEKIVPLEIEIFYKNSKPQIRLKNLQSKYSFKISVHRNIEINRIVPKAIGSGKNGNSITFKTCIFASIIANAT